MPSPLLEEVFKIGGVPTHTFVEPQEFTQLSVSLRTPGRGMVVEGPSGIGKTSAVETCLHALGLGGKALKLTPRKKADIEYIEALPDLDHNVGIVIVDDFHKLPDATKSRLAEYMKTLADEERADAKVVAVGINRAGERLIQFAGDLVNRIDIIKFESNPEHKVRELISKGEHALNIRINVQEEIIDAAQGSFYIAQMLCHEICLRSGLLERAESLVNTALSFEGIRAKVLDQLGRRFRSICRDFCRGTKMKSEGRAPYLHLLNWLATKRQWSIDIEEELLVHKELRGSVNQVVEKGFLETLIRSKPGLQEVIHFQRQPDLLTVEDPQFVFYIRNLPWAAFARECGFLSVEFRRRYDFALSFAGRDRDIAESAFELLQEEQVEVFYDKNEQHRILAEDVEEYLAPIYQSESRFVICLMGPDYPRRIWTKFESDHFRTRMGSGEVIPVWIDTEPSTFDAAKTVGAHFLHRGPDLEPKIKELVRLLMKKMRDARYADKNTTSS